MVDDESIEARLAAIYELFCLDDLTLQESRQGFESIRGIVREELLEIGDSLGLRERVALYADALVETTVFLADIAAKERGHYA
jgi:hypothetical protein